MGQTSPPWFGCFGQLSHFLISLNSKRRIGHLRLRRVLAYGKGCFAKVEDKSCKSGFEELHLSYPSSRLSACPTLHMQGIFKGIDLALVKVGQRSNKDVYWVQADGTLCGDKPAKQWHIMDLLFNGYGIMLIPPLFCKRFLGQLRIKGLGLPCGMFVCDLSVL